ncbi:MAG: hypothetical protein HY088_04490 [Ignavibacteriales bacterium]|nr:hypothetical protein [Ignavibacteriales bacterium]
MMSPKLPPEVVQPPLEPIERYTPIALKLSVYIFLTVIFFQAIETFSEVRWFMTPWPLLLRLVRNGIFLFIHEGGHMLFFFFGRMLHILGGSFWQIVFPLLSFLIALRQRSQMAPFALFWVGENMLDVSLYMRDAPLRRLPLLGGHKSGHDWYNLFRMWDMMDSAETVADSMYYLGAVICVGSIVAGIAWSVYSFLKPASKVQTVRIPAKILDSKPLDENL